MAYITEEGVYSISQDDYHADPVCEPSFSASIAQILREKTALHAWGAHPRLNPQHERKFVDHLAFGELAHALMLHDERLLEVIDAPDWKKKETRDLRDAAIEKGKIPALTKDFERAKAMVAIGRRQIDAHEHVRGAFRTGQAEVTLVWREPIPDRKCEIWCRCRLDFLHGTNFEYVTAKGSNWSKLQLSRFQRSSNVFPDYKTTQKSAALDAWGRGPLRQHGNDLRAAFYLRGIKRLFDCKHAHYTFIVQETTPPFALNVIAPQYPMIDRANDQLDQCLDYWTWCLGKDWWPGYPRKTCYAELFPWEMRAWEDHQQLERALKIEERDALFAEGIAMQAPLGNEGEIPVDDAADGDW